MDKNQLKNVGLKITNPRVKVLALLESSSAGHMSAESIYQALHDNGEDIGLATVYRVLGQFEQAGLVSRHNFEDGYCVFELEQGEHHDHLVCVKCRQVTEFCDQVIEQQQKNLAVQHGFKMTDHNLTIYGLCQTCQLL